MKTLHLPILGLLAATVAAQAPSRFVPHDAQLVVRIAAPARWKSEFADTKIAQVFAGPALAPVMAQLEAAITGAELAASGMDPKLMEGLWNDYKGDLVVAIRLDIDDVRDALIEDRTPKMAMSIALTPDGTFDLAGLAAQLCEMIETTADRDLVDLQIGDHLLRCAAPAEDGSATLPAMIDDHLVMVWSTDLENEGARMLANDDRRAASGAGKAMYLHVDAEKTIETLLDVVAAQMENDPSAPPFDVPGLMRSMGFGCLRSIDVSIEADGEQLVMESHLATSDEDHGLFGMVLVDEPTQRLLRYVPHSANGFTHQPFDIKALYSTFAEMWGAMSMFVPMSFDEVELAFEDATKVRLREDLFDQFGNEMLYLVDFEAGDDLDPEDFGAFFAGTCYALSLRDGKAFGESLEKALRSRGLHAARKTQEYQGVNVYRLRIAGAFEIEYAVTDDLFLLAPGGDEVSRAQLRSILDTRADPQADLHPTIAEYRDTVPSGWNGVGVTPLAEVFTQIGSIMSEVAPYEVPPEAQMIFGVLGQIGGDMKQVGLDKAVQFSWSSPAGIRSVLRM